MYEHGKYYIGKAAPLLHYFKHYVMKTYGGLQVELQVVNLKSVPPYCRYQFNSKLGGPQDRSGRCGEE
jgi:hypothetical protein